MNEKKVVRRKPRADHIRPDDSNNIIDLFVRHLDLANDAAFAKLIKYSAPAVSKIRNGQVNLGGDFVIRVHEATGMTVMDIKVMILNSDQGSMLRTFKEYDDPNPCRPKKHHE